MKRLMWAMLGIVGTRWAMKAFRNRLQPSPTSSQIENLQNQYRRLDEVPPAQEPRTRFGT